MAANVHLFGIRHHGPGCARSLVRALEELAPDVVLVEGPPDAEALLPLVIEEGMQPPVALMIYAVENPKDAAFYPFAEYSPEWQAIRHALKAGVPIRFIDLPQAHQMALGKERPQPEAPSSTEPAAASESGEDRERAAPEGAGASPGEVAAAAGEAAPPAGETSDDTPEDDGDDPRHDPLGWLSRAAGYGDGEEWWEHMVEQRRDGTGLFAAIAEAMTALRAESRPPANAFETRREALREAHMRKGIRTAQKEGRERIAVICGAWHVPALAEMPSASADADLLKGLPKTKVEVAWIPWTYQRLAMESGYGAGVASPAWYEHLWQRNDGAGGAVIAWFARVARLLRQQDLDCSSAHLIECVRLSETLAALRERPLPGLGEMMEAARAILSMGDDTALRLIRRDLVLGHRMGQVPPGAPAVPLQRDIEKVQKTLRLKVTATREALELDLRKESDLARSILLHRLRLLGVKWGELTGARGGKGTFRETWQIQWQPEFALAIVEASPYGNTVLEAASALCSKQAREAAALPVLTGLVDSVLLADSSQALHTVMVELNNRAAVTGDLPQLMGAIPALAQVSRYGNVRQTDTAQVLHVLDGLIARVCIGLSPACQSLDEEAASQMSRQVQQVHAAIVLVDKAEHREGWHSSLRQVSGAAGAHALLAGLSVRLLFDAHASDAQNVSSQMSRALSRGVTPESSAAWLQGFLSGGGMVLVHDAALFQLVDEWLTHLSEDHFIQVLPLIRRTFATFPSMERRQMGDRVKQGGGGVPAVTLDETEWDATRLVGLLPALRSILGTGSRDDDASMSKDP